MRPIKFRAWDTKRNKMWSPEEMGKDQLTISPDGRGFVNVSGIDIRLSKYYDFLIPEQFTGLLDKNGVKIFEGDIVKKLDGSYNPRHVISWGFHSDHSSYMYQLGWNLWEDEDYKVIGNIHENPELLK